MIHITPHMHIFIALENIDFRKGIDGLAAACRQKLH
jgi:transposase